MSLKITVRGNRAVLSGLDEYNKRVQALVQSELKEWASKTEADAKRDVPVDSGALRNSITADVENNGLTWTVGTNVSYAPFQEFGTGGLVDIPAGLEAYSSQFRGAGIRQVNLPARSYLFINARRNFEETVKNIRKLLDKQK